MYYFDSHVLALKSSYFTPYGVFNELLLNSTGGLIDKVLVVVVVVVLVVVTVLVIYRQ